MRSLIQFHGAACSVPALVGEALGSADPAAVDSAADLVSAAWSRVIGRDRPLEGGLGIAPDIGRSAGGPAGGVAGRWDAIAGLAEEANLERLNIHGRWKEYAVLLRLGVEAAG